MVRGGNIAIAIARTTGRTNFAHLPLDGLCTISMVLYWNARSSTIPNRLTSCRRSFGSPYPSRQANLDPSQQLSLPFFVYCSNDTRRRKPVCRRLLPRSTRSSPPCHLYTLELDLLGRSADQLYCQSNMPMSAQPPSMRISCTHSP